MNTNKTYLYHRDFRNNCTLFGEKRVIFDVIERRLEDGTEVLIDSNNEECRLENVLINVQKTTDLNLTTCRNNADFNALKKDVTAQKKKLTHDLAKHSHDISETMHVKASKDLYLYLNPFKNNSENFLGLISEDLHGGVKIENLTDTWIGLNEGESGVFNALHPNNSDSVIGVIQNATYLEFSITPSDKKSAKTNIETFEDEFDDEMEELNTSVSTAHADFLKNEKTVIKSVNGHSDLLQKFDNFTKFLNINISSSDTNQLNLEPKNPNVSNVKFANFTLDKKGIINDLQKINIVLADESASDKTSHLLTDDDIVALQAYKTVLVRMLKVENLKEKSEIIKTSQQEESIKTLQIRIEKTKTNIQKVNTEIKKLKNEAVESKKKIAQLEQKLFFLQSDLNLFEKTLHMLSPLYPNEKAYFDIFEHERDKTTGEIIGTKVKKAENAIARLKEFHAWIGEKMFAGISYSVNKGVKALLVAGAYRGNYSPVELNAALKSLSDNNRIEKFSEVILSRSQNKLRKFITDNSSAFEGGLDDKFLKSSDSWSDPKLPGNKPTLDENSVLAIHEKKSVQAFYNNWGFNIGIAYDKYLLLNGKKIIPNENDLQGNEKKNGIVLDKALWIDENGNVENSLEMKNYLSSLLSSIIGIKVNENIETQIFNNINIPNDKKDLYVRICNRAWDGSEPDLIAFVKTIKGQFEKKEALQIQYGVVSFASGVKKAIDAEREDDGTVSETLSYAVDKAMSGDPVYMGIFAFAAYLMVKNTSGADNKGLHWLKVALVGTGVVATANYVVDDIGGVDVINEVRKFVTGGPEATQNNPIHMVVREMNKDGRNLGEKMEGYPTGETLLNAGLSVSQANFPEVLQWYQECRAKSETSGDIYSINLPSGIKNTMEIIYPNGAINNRTDEESAKAAYEFVDLYLRNISLNLNSSINNGLGNPSVGLRYLANRYELSGAKANETYIEDSTVKTGYRFGEVMKYEMGFENIQEFAERNLPIVEDVQKIASDVGKVGNSLVRKFTDDEETSKYRAEVKNNRDAKEVTV